MKAMILAGGLGTRLAEETATKPKPLVEIGGFPILWHVMKIYAHCGVTDFIICLGHKGDLIREYFLNAFHRGSDFTIDLQSDRISIHKTQSEPWRVTLVETGVQTMTGGRIKRAAEYLGSDEEFCLTYADGVADVDVGDLIRSHREGGRLATVTAVQAPDRFGRIAMDNGCAMRFEEKPRAADWINAGYFVVNRKAIDLVADDLTVWEREPLRKLTADGQLGVYCHTGFWMCMDTLQERQTLENLWSSGKPPWKVWANGRSEAGQAALASNERGGRVRSWTDKEPNGRRSLVF